MDESFRLGRIAGIPVGINWSVLVVLWLISWSLAAEQLPTGHPGHSTFEYWVVGTAAAAVFLASLLAHEVGHSLVARRHGVQVERITLWLFGGVAVLRSEATSPRAELRIALAGPAVSIAVALVAGAVALGLDALDLFDLVGGAAAWLAFINVFLALFNLVPAAPLDGGRVLRAVLWRRHGDRWRATLQASQAGRTFGYVLIALGIAEFALGGGIGGLWLMFIGWFLLTAAQAEAAQALLRDALAGLTVSSVMTRDPIVAPDHLSVAELIDDVVLRHRASAFPLVDIGGRLTGFVTLGQLKQVPPSHRAATLVRDVSEPLARVPTARPDEPLSDLVSRLSADETHRRALVFHDGRLVGIVTPTDITRAIELANLRRGRV